MAAGKCTFWSWVVCFDYKSTLNDSDRNEIPGYFMKKDEFFQVTIKSLFKRPMFEWTGRKWSFHCHQLCFVSLNTISFHYTRWLMISSTVIPSASALKFLTIRCRRTAVATALTSSISGEYFPLSAA